MKNRSADKLIRRAIYAAAVQLIRMLVMDHYDGKKHTLCIDRIEMQDVFEALGFYDGSRSKCFITIEFE